MSDTPTFLLVPGSWHGAWVWERLRPVLDRHGFATVAVDLASVGDDPARLGSLDDDARIIADAAAAVDGDVILVAHSYGGAPTSYAKFSENVRRLVFLAAFMPGDGRTYPSYLPPGPLPRYVGVNDDGTMSVPPGESREAFYHDCLAEVAAWADARLRPQSQAVLSVPIGRASWHDIPTTYIVASEDRAIPPFLQREFAAGANEVREIRSSHSPMLSRPDVLAEILADIATAR